MYAVRYIQVKNVKLSFSFSSICDLRIDVKPYAVKRPIGRL